MYILKFLEKTEKEFLNDVELFISHLLKIPPLEVYLKKDLVLNPMQIKTLDEWMKRRKKHEPLQYILGEVDFYGNRIKVTRDVLIPRPETEQLVEVVLERMFPPHPRPLPLGERERERGRLKILDIGTGSGCIAITLAKEIEKVEIIATDNSKAALKIAKENARANGVDWKIDFIEADIFPGESPRVFGGQVTLASCGAGQAKNVICPRITRHLFDLIISNPPYCLSGEFENLQPEVRDWEPRSALDGGKDGLDFYRRIFKEVPRFLKPGGLLALEIGEDQGEKLGTWTLLRVPSFSGEIRKDLAGRDRFLLAQYF